MANQYDREDQGMKKWLFIILSYFVSQLSLAFLFSYIQRKQKVVTGGQTGHSPI